MFRVDNASAVSPIPTPGAPGPKPDSFFGDGSTVLPADWLNAVQEELAYIIENSPSSPALNKTDRTQVYTAILDIIQNASGSLNYNNLFHIEDQQPSGTTGGVGVGATWNVRTLNTSVVANIASASLAANQITLPAGTYVVMADAPAQHVFGALNNQHKIRLRNITDGATVAVGTSEAVGQNQVEIDQSRSFMTGAFTIAASKVFELQHYTVQASGLGAPVTSGEVEVYSKISIYKVA